MKPKVIIYDFDGVVCDSVNVKTEAFVKLYKSYGISNILKKHISFKNNLIKIPQTRIDIVTTIPQVITNNQFNLIFFEMFYGFYLLHLNYLI